MSKFNDVLAALTAENESVQHELQQLNLRRTQLIEDSKRIGKAIAALSGSRKKTTGLKTPTLDVFRQIAAEILRIENDLEDVVLKKRIRQSLKNSGHSSAGLTGFFAEFVKDDRIRVDQNRISIRDGIPQDPNGIS